MLIHNFTRTLGRCFVLVVSAILFHTIDSLSFASPTETHRLVTVPFTGAQVDSDYRPHQLVTVGVRADTSSPLTIGTFLFDTGASGSFISESFAQKLNTPQYQAANVSINHGFISKMREATKVATLEVGELHIQSPVFYILPDQELAVGTNQRIDGVLGADMWSSFAIHIDFTHSLIAFVVPLNEGLSYNALNQNPIQLSSTEVAQQGFKAAVSIPMIEYNGSFFTSVIVRDGSSVTTDLLAVDSGSDVTFLSQQAAQKLNLQTISKQDTVIFPGIRKTSNLAWLQSFISGDLTLNNLLVRSNAEDQSISTLGLDVLANYDILLDFPRRKIFLKPRSDLCTVTSRQYEVASPAQRRQWARAKLIVAYPTSTLDVGLAIPYDLTGDCLPLTQVWPDKITTSVQFLLSSDIKNTFISDDLSKLWDIDPQVVIDNIGNPRLLFGSVVRSVALSKLHIAGASGKVRLGVLPADGLLHYTNNLSLKGVVGANVLFARPLLMDAMTQTWFMLTGLYPEDLPSLGMADAAVMDILDPDKDGIPAVAVQVQQGAARFTDTMTLATGSPFTLLSAKAAKTLKLTPEPKMLNYGAGKGITVFNQARLSQLSIGGVVLKNVPVAYPVGAMPDGFSPHLGMNVISQLRLLVDTPNKRMYVKKAGK